MSYRGIRIAAAAALSVFLMACGGGEGPAEGTDSGDAAAGAGDAPAAVASAPAVESVGDLLATADVDRGKTLYFQCRACHSLAEGAAHKVGPNLHGMFGRKAGMAEGFTYSEVLKNSGVVWDVDTVNEWLARPSQFLPGNLMVFVGIKKPEDRASLIKYLQQATE